MEQQAAAELGGTSAARIIFWLKLWNAIVFLGVVLGLDRMLRSDPARRARAHLLWSVNPLVLWGLVAAGHLDVFAAAAGFFGLALVRARRVERPGSPEPDDGGRSRSSRWPRASWSGWPRTSCSPTCCSPWRWPGRCGGGPRRCSPRRPAWPSLSCPRYLWAGRPLVHSLLLRRGKVSADNFYQLFSAAYRHPLPPGADLAVVLAFGALALLLLWRLPDAVPDLPAIQPALAIGIAWLFMWYYQLPWYDVMIIALLALYPASRLDYVVIVQLTAGSFAMMPGGSPLEPPLGWLRTFTHETGSPGCRWCCSPAWWRWSCCACPAPGTSARGRRPACRARTGA